MFPDLDIIKFVKFFFVCLKLSISKLSIKLIFFLIVLLKKLKIAFAPKIEPPIPIILKLNFFLIFKFLKS